METLTKQATRSKPEHTILEVLEFCKARVLPARVVGKWVWIKFETKPAADIRQALKAFGFRWSHRRQQWAHNCGHYARPAHNYKPWDRYQTISIDEAERRIG